MNEVLEQLRHATPDVPLTVMQQIFSLAERGLLQIIVEPDSVTLVNLANPGHLTGDADQVIMHGLFGHQLEQSRVLLRARAFPKLSTHLDWTAEMTLAGTGHLRYKTIPLRWLVTPLAVVASIILMWITIPEDSGAAASFSQFMVYVAIIYLALHLPRSVRLHLRITPKGEALLAEYNPGQPPFLRLSEALQNDPTEPQWRGFAGARPGWLEGEWTEGQPDFNRPLIATVIGQIELATSKRPAAVTKANQTT